MSAIWTSRYSNQELKKGSYYPVGISIGRPKWPLGYELRDQCYSLAPKGYMLNMEHDPYKEAYREKLEAIGTEKIIDIVNRLSMRAVAEGKDLVLLCFEDVRVPGQWCHRTMFAEWWTEKTGEVVSELFDPSEPKIKKATEPKKEPKKTVEKVTIKKPVGMEPGFDQLSLFEMLEL